MKLTKIIVLAACLLVYSKEVYAGNVTTDPVADSSQIVIISPDDTVVFNASADNDDYVDIGDSTFDNGTASFGRGEGTGTATVTFTSAATGLDGGSKCKIIINSEYTPLNETCSTDKEIDFEVDVPKITVAVNGGSINTSSSYAFNDNVNVAGVTNLSEIEITQLITADTTKVPYSGGGAQPYGTGVPWNCSNATDTDWDWGMVYNPNADEQALSASTSSIVISGTTYNYTQLEYRALDFVVKVRRKNDQTVVSEFDWGYKWDNYNSQWTSSTTPPLPSSITSAAFVGSTASTSGEFYGQYGITGL